MATTLSSEELIQQAKLLSTKTNNATNPNMKYSTMLTRNTALNPDYFSAAQSSIVNAINLIYKNNLNTDEQVNTFGNTIGDTSNKEIAEKFENLKALMGSSTIIEGLEDLYKNKLVVKDNLTETVKTIVGEQAKSIVEQTVDEKLSWTDNAEQ